MLDYIDIHSHLHFKDFDTDREKIISEMEKNKIATISVGVDWETSKKEVEISQNSENIFATVGFHPDHPEISQEFVFEKEFSDLAKNSKVVAIGECGLDYFYPSDSGQIDEERKKIQKKLFEEQINLSLFCNKPLMLHMRPSKGTEDAYLDTLEILESYAKNEGEKLRGNAHFFAGSTEILKKFLSIGFTVSFTGVITFTHDYDELICSTPLDMIMSETDAPFVAPVPYRGKRNSPLYIKEVVKAIAEIRKESLELVKDKLVENAKRTFNLPI